MGGETGMVSPLLLHFTYVQFQQIATYTCILPIYFATKM